MKNLELYEDARRRYPFRARGPDETFAAYDAAFIEHVERFDIGLGHELRCGRHQEHWTAVDIDDFRRRMLGAHRQPREELQPGRAIPMTQIAAGLAATEASLLELAEGGLETYIKLRQGNADPQHVCPIIVHVLTTDGRLCLTASSRGDRVAIVKTLVKTLPVFGFFVLNDAFVHKMPVEGERGPAVKQDCVMEHIGTREMRRMVLRPYRFEGQRVQFIEPYPEPMDKRGADVQFDPYAGVFASEPQSRRTQ